MSYIHEGQVMTEEDIDAIIKPPKTGSGVQRPQTTISCKEEIILRLVESLNRGGEEGYYDRVDVAFMQYEQIQKKLNGWREF